MYLKQERTHPKYETRKFFFDKKNVFENTISKQKFSKQRKQ